MKKKTISDAITNIGTEYIEKAADYTVEKKTRKPVWVKWAAMAACLCLVVVGALTIPNLQNEPQQGQGNNIQDIAPMVCINDMLYKQSAKQISYAELKEDFVYLGEIESEISSDNSIKDGIPRKNFQANHAIVGSKVYQFGDDIVIEIKGEYWLYEHFENGGDNNIPVRGGNPNAYETQQGNEVENTQPAKTDTGMGKPVAGGATNSDEVQQNNEIESTQPAQTDD